MLKKKLILIITIIAGILIVLSLSLSYQSSIKGTVVDAETGKPVEGAVVLVEWTKQIGIGDYHTESVKVVETVTDKEGKFFVRGPIHAFFDEQDVTIYKKGYVAWNNKYIFPAYEHRQSSGYIYQATRQEIRLEHYRDAYSHNKHVSFIESCSHDALASNKKRKFAAAYDWELDLAREEVLRNK